MRRRMLWLGSIMLVLLQMAASPRGAFGVSGADFRFWAPLISGHRYNPSGGSWTFSGSTGNGSRLIGNGSAFLNPNAPQGVQAAFVQEHGTISQAISGFTPGTPYMISFFAAERPGND